MTREFLEAIGVLSGIGMTVFFIVGIVAMAVGFVSALADPELTASKKSDKSPRPPQS
jgi:hypothetical protein